MRANGFPFKTSLATHPQVSFKKRWWLALIVLMAGAVNCRNLSPKVPPPTVIVPAGVQAGERLTQSGENQQGVLSADNKKLLFVSSQRSDHAQPQIYEKDLTSGRETRLTFHTGEASRPQYGRTSREILYASTTDELKEDPVFLRNKLQMARPTSDVPFELQGLSEIYLHDLEKSEIERLTQHPGFDGWACPHKGDKITWTRVDKNKLEIKTKNLSGTGESSVRVSTSSPAQFCFAPNGRDAAWISYAEDFKTSTLWVLRDGQPVQLVAGLQGLISDLAWAPLSPVILFSYQSQPGRPWSIHSIKTDDTCLSLWSSGGAHDRYPALSPDEKTLVFSSNANKSWQIYRKPWSGPCPSSAK